MRLSRLWIVPLALAAVAGDVTAQDRTTREREAREARERAERDRAEARGGVRVFRTGEDEDRAVLGISTGSSGDRDTLGLLVTSVTPGGPAEKAGIEEGNRIAAINGVNLRLSREDAGERDMVGLTSRRLTREMGKIKAGDEVELRVWQSGNYKNIKVKTIAADELSPRRVSLSRSESGARPVVGISLGSSGSKRDTLGVLVVGVTENGPAEKAGIIEGDRIQSVNGVNLRVSSEDAGDSWMSQARAQRLRRELSEASVGERLEMRVWSGGQVKTVTVVPVRSDSLYKGERQNMRMFFGESGFFTPPVPPLPPMAPMPPRIHLDDDMSFRIERSIDRALEAVRVPRIIDGRALDAIERLESIHVEPRRIRVIPRDRIVTEPSLAPAAAPVYGARLASLRASVAPAPLAPVVAQPARTIVHY